ncbi:MAG: LLM class F420-dependent oxidoreductase [Deltaproteobacteria bacterium]
MMKFGITLPNYGKYADKDSLLTLATAAERLGFDSLWVSDHIVIPKSHKGFGDLFFEPLTTLAFIAASTVKIALGTSVIILPYRNPLVLAKEVATLDALSGGRVIFGVGVGWIEDEFKALGVPYADRGAMSDEYLEVIKTLWREDNPSFNGRFAEFRDIAFLPKPHQEPRPPILVGGNGKLARERAFRVGDGWHPVGLVAGEIAEGMRHLAGLGAPSDFTIILRKNLQILSGRAKSDVVDPREPLRSTAEGVVAALREYERAGVSHLIFQILGGAFEAIIETMEVFSSEVKTRL